ncbi:hypothetical protein ABL78_8146 [Leptomonas seymouri]|uniref:Uncharacterized protein n=1 Tax=Leptomonas seymouri TaxID=5684 RepID=A0A0N1I105_LEPSE|nr:hypothetical protein ABL78_8146 [Leptomonas seymouri]|eukprot:KPI82843.1 hypothetical protein ABL78_8146 [Leptomonas seymouri]
MRVAAVGGECFLEEEEERRRVWSNEQQSRIALLVDWKLLLKVMAMLVKRLDDVVHDEFLARRGIVLDEKGDRVLLGERHDALFDFLVAAFESSPVEANLEAATVSSLTAAAASLRLQRIGRGYLLRWRLQRRLQNRRRDLFKQGVTRILADEFTHRRELVGEEYLARRGTYERMNTPVAVALNGRPLAPVLQDLLVEEERLRRGILDDYAAIHDAIERAEHKQFLKHTSAIFTPEQSDPSEEEESEGFQSPEMLRHAGSVWSAHRRDNTPRRRYKGFELDALGRFLLDYESDLNRMQIELADFRRQVAFEHDQIKDVRDRAAQEVVRGGTGAMWVPARPLPLSDLVRGPSAQYEGKRRL